MALKPSRSRFLQHRSTTSLMTSSWLFFQCFHSKRAYFVWLTIFFYAIGAFYAYNVYYFDRNVSTERQNGDVQEPKEQQFNFQFHEDRKRILFWTKFYKEDTLDSYCIRPDTLRECPYSKCEFTTDKNLLTTSDAVIFHGRDLWGHRTIEGSSDRYIEMPKFRSEYQSWIFLMFEAPVHTWINLEPFDNDIFNMTMTYRSDSDIYIPYGRVVPIQHQQTSADFHSVKNHHEIFSNKDSSTKKKRLVAWSVSNCYKTPSRRNEVVHELHKYISIDIYGDCGSYTCTPYVSLCESGLRCHQYLADKYKFYLAFENSLCSEYITEKFFDSLNVGMVPIVYGYGDYSRVAPKGSYIDASVFPTMKSLADYLYYLDRHPSEYEKYFEWKQHYRVTVSYFDDAWCSLCTKLWTSTMNSTSTTSFSTENQLVSKHKYDVVRRQVKNLTDWWFHKPSLPNSTSGNLKENVCLSPTQLKWDNNIFSFYGFIYYPNYSVKMGIIYGLLSILLLALLICILRALRTQFVYKGNRGK